MKVTKPLIKAAIALMAKPNETHWGYKLSEQSGVRTSRMYPLLQRMLDEGWLEAIWEDEQDAIDRPRRRFVKLTDDGRRELGAVLARAEHDRRYEGIAVGWAR